MSTRLDAHIARLKARPYHWPVPWEVVEALARKEGCRLVAYQCIAGKWTIAWGETDGVTADMRWSEDQVDYRFWKEICRYAAAVEQMLERPADENQLGGMLSLAYNIGLGSPKDTKHKRGFYWSSVRRLHNAGDYVGAARAFMLQNKYRNPQSGQLEVSEGLTARRAAEAAMYLQAVGDAPPAPAPQAVEPESAIASSPIARGGAATVATGVAVAGAQVVDQLPAAAPAIAEQVGAVGGLVASVKDVAQQASEFVGIPSWVFVVGVLVYVGFNEIRWRMRQRQEGWA
jgi:lysozyme